MDPHLTRGGPMANVHSAVLSRLLNYVDERTGVIAPDVADALPLDQVLNLSVSELEKRVIPFLKLASA